MFAYILSAPALPQTPQTDDFFRRFCETPGLLHAFELSRVDDPDESLMVAVWESREAAERYLNGAPLRQEVDEAIPSVTRTMYNVLGHK
jgi:heme-degrading monooxygenase HmoA